MRKTLLFLAISLILFSCDQSTQVSEQCMEIHLIPQAKEIHSSPHALILSTDSKLFSPDAEVQALLSLFSEELELLGGHCLEIENKISSYSDIVFEIQEDLFIDEYTIDITDHVILRGGSYQALAMAKNTLLQLLEIQNEQIVFPLLSIYNQPDASYRGIMLDLARQWHDLETIKKVIDMAAFYQSNYVHLHFSDYQSYTLPSKAFPKLSTQGKTYSYEALEGLEIYSQLRGITLIPEIDIPGHSSPFVEKYPEIFAIQAVDENPWIIHMGKEEVYEALDIIIVELCQIFKATPYFHIGGDEAIFHKTTEDTEVQAYMKKHKLGEEVHELYRHFLVRMNEIIKKQDKQMCVWEGFRRDGQVEIPKDILVFEFETNRYLPNHLVEDGYTVVNTSWKPLYVVNKKKWEPKTIYAWNLWRWENWYPKAPSFTPIQVDQTPLIIGAQMCAWEQSGASEVPSLRKRLPVMNERIWNSHQKISFEKFYLHLAVLDNKLSLLIKDKRQDDVLEGHNFSKELE